jgi:hypothetical protein
VDLLLLDELEHGLAARDHIARLANDARWQERLADAATRVTSFRRQLARRVRPSEPPELAQILRAPDERFAAIQEAAIAQVGDPKHLPLPRSGILLMAVPRALDLDRKIDLAWLEAKLRAHFPGARVVPFDPGPEAPALLRAAMAGLGADASGAAVVLASLGRGDTKWISETAAAIGDGPGPRLGVALHRPAEVLEMPASWTRLITYGFGRNAFRALIRVMAGECTARGIVLGLGAREHEPGAGTRLAADRGRAH